MDDGIQMRSSLSPPLFSPPPFIETLLARAAKTRYLLSGGGWTFSPLPFSLLRDHQPKIENKISEI